MSIDEAVSEWSLKNRRMGCVNATKWFCKKVNGFYPKRLTLYTDNGEIYQHVVATNGVIDIDISPYACKPR